MKNISKILVACVVMALIAALAIIPSSAAEGDVATVGGVSYTDLQSAIDAANGGTVTLISDVTLSSTVTVPAGHTVTLDLNGKTVSMVQSETVSANHEMIMNSGNLTILDTAGNGKLSYKYTGASLGTTYAANTVVSNPGSTLTVKGGTIENLTFDSAIIAYAIDARTNGGAGDVSVVVEGGAISSERQSIRVFANSTTHTGTLKISGGDITGRVIVQNANASANKAALKINGGTFNANNYKTDVLYVGGSDGATIDMQPVVSGGTFNGEINSNMTEGFIIGGSFDTDVSEYCKDGYVLSANEDGSYGVRDSLLPEAEVLYINSSLNEDAPDLTFALNFQIKGYDSFTEDYVNALFNKYGSYYVDYVLTIEGLTTDSEVVFNADGSADGYLAGQYDEWSENWVSVPFEDVTLKNGESIFIMEYAASLMGKQGLRMTLEEIATIVQDFNCGVYFTPEFLEANPDMVVTLELLVFNEDTAGEIDEKHSIGVYEFTVEDSVKLPQADVVDITDTLDENAPDLTFALNFQIKGYESFTEDYINALFNKYGKYYVDYVLTIEGLTTDSEVVFNANGGEGVDGYLAGQYKSWSDSWVSVPFENAVVPNGGSIMIMKTAAEMLNKPGLRMNLEEIATIVQDFNCGVYFTPEFLASNPNMVVTLELMVFTEDAAGEINEKHSIGIYQFDLIPDEDDCNHIFEIKNDGHLYVSTDGGNTWQDLGQVVGNDGNDGNNGNDGNDGVGIQDVVVTPIEGGNKVTITLTNGNTFEFDVMNGTDGEDGEDGEDGKDAVTPKFELRDDGHLYVSYDNGASWTDLGKVVGEDGKDGEDGEDGAPGADGEDGEDGAPGQNGAPGADGEDGKDGLGIANIEINANGELIITYTDGTSKNLGNVMGSNGSNGADGEDGEDGAPGQDGADGEDGKDGVDGKTPSFKLDENGDLFIRYSEEDEWTLLGNIKGQTGDKGDNGADGEDGKDGLNIQIPTSNGNFDTIVLIIIAAVSIVAIATVAIVVLSNRHSYCKPWWLI